MAAGAADLSVLAEHIRTADMEDVPEGEDSLLVGSGNAAKVGAYPSGCSWLLGVRLPAVSVQPAWKWCGRLLCLNSWVRQPWWVGSYLYTPLGWCVGCCARKAGIG